MSEYISLRQRYPEKEGNYKVQNIRQDLEGTARYDGCDFCDVDWNLPLKGHCMLPSLDVTHWMPLPEKKHQCQTDSIICKSVELDDGTPLLCLDIKINDRIHRTFSINFCPICGEKA